jgi:hypothetical protein
MNTTYRIEDKGNVRMNGKRTTFKLFKDAGEFFVHVGSYSAPGWDQSDAACISSALETLDKLSNES